MREPLRAPGRAPSRSPAAVAAAGLQAGQAAQAEAQAEAAKVIAVSIRIEIDQLDQVVVGLERYEETVYLYTPTLASLQRDLQALCTIERTLIRRIQYLEAELQELRA
jgi:hypothetical protein